jgi:NAD(P)H-hydrate epimerase
MGELSFPARPVHLHKGDAGRLLIVGGSARYPGAPLLAARGALRAGAGLVTLATPISALIAGRLPETTLLALTLDHDGMIDPARAASQLTAEQSDALLVGPGLEPSERVAELVRRLALTEGSPLLLDAGALRAIADDPERLIGAPARPLVLTPHIGEFLALSGAQSADERTVRDFAERAGAIIVCKGSTTLIAHPDGRFERRGLPNPLLATGGTGDVLAGVIGALLAGGLAPYEAALLGVSWHSAAGLRLALRLGDAGLLASELADVLPLVRLEARTE